MTAEKIDKISRYANGLYYRNYEQWELKGESFEDFRQTLLLLAFEYPDDTPALLVKRFRYSKMCAIEAISLQIRNMTPFSVLTEGTDDENEFIEKLCGVVEDEYEDEKEKSCIVQIACYLYEKPELRDMFLDYMHGQSVGSGRQRDCREKLFRKRFEILAILRQNEKIDEREEKRLTAIAQEMTKPAPVQREIKDTATARANRAYYERNKEKFAERAKRNNEKRKNARKTGKK